MSKEYLDKRMSSKWLSKGIKASMFPDYPLAINPRAGRARMAQIAKEVGSYADLYAGDQRGYAYPPEYVLKATTTAINQGAFGYFTWSELAHELQTLQANRYRQWYDVDIDPISEATLSMGAAFTIDTSIRILTDPGDEVLICDPDYITYAAQIAGYNCKPVSVPLREDPPGKWHFDIDRLEAAITPKTRLFMFSNANNPSSYMYTAKDCADIMNLAEQHDFWILNDQVSEEILFDGVKYNSLLSIPGAMERTVTCASFSKLYNLSGLRLGFAFARPEFLEHLNEINEWAVDGIVTPGVHAALAYLRNKEQTATYAHQSLADLKQRRDYMISRLNEMEGIIPNTPQGLWWMFPWVDIDKFGKTTQEIAEYLLREEQVFIRPGTWYGKTSEGHFRISFCVNPAWIEDGMNKMEHGIRKLLG